MACTFQFNTTFNISQVLQSNYKTHKKLFYCYIRIYNVCYKNGQKRILYKVLDDRTNHDTFAPQTRAIRNYYLNQRFPTGGTRKIIHLNLVETHEKK